MNISPVNYINNFNNINHKNTKTKAPTFEGLWGKTTFSSDVDPAIGVLKVQETYYYYPFMDEGETQIASEVAKNSDAQFSNEDPPRYFVKDCRLCSTLPFTQNEYNAYKKATSPTDKNLDIHSYAQKLYTNNAYASGQTSATNLNLQS